MAAPSIFVFNEAYYLAQNPDVAAAVAAGAIESGLAHWKVFGWAEGRTASKFFDWEVYRDNNPDLAEAGITTQADLTRHFNIYGVNENRVFLSSQVFDAQYYAAHNPDLAAAGITSLEALEQHFKSFGVYEGRIASPLIDGASYVNQNPDLKALLAAGGNLGGFTNSDAAGIWHYYNYGISEGRSLGSPRAADPPPIAVDDVPPTAAQTQPITVTDTDSNGVYDGGDVIHLRFSEPVSVSGLAGQLLPVNAIDGYATEFQWVMPPNISMSPGTVISFGKEYIIDRAGNHATSDVGFLLPSLPKLPPKLPPQYPSFGISIDVGGDAYINAAETSSYSSLSHTSVTEITANVTSSVLRSLVVSGMSGSQQLEQTAVWNPSSQKYEFDAADFDDGVLTVLATDVYSQTRTFTLTKDTVGPSILAFSVAGPTSLFVESSEAGSAGLYNNNALILGTSTQVDANYPHQATITVAAQSSVVTATMAVFDYAGMGDTSTTAVVLGTENADVSLAGSVGSDFMFGFGGNDSMMGVASNDVIYGGDGNDTIRGGEGNDSLIGEAGNDRFMYDIGSSLSNQGIQPRYDTIDGSDGFDTIYATSSNSAPIGADLTDTDFANVSNMEAITLASGSNGASVVLGSYANTAFTNGVTVTVDPSTTVNATVDGTAYTHNMTVTGGAYDDSISGGNADDSLAGGNGNDTLTGGGGNDTMTGGAGFNTFNVDAVTDTITDLKAGDTLNVTAGAYAYVSLLDLTSATVSNSGTIYVTGTSGADSINGSAGLDIIDGADGNDTINGRSGMDQLNGGNGNDTFVFEDNVALRFGNVNTVAGGDGTDRIQFTTAINTLAGDPLNNNFHADFTQVSSVEQVELFGASSVNLGSVFRDVGVTTIITGNDNTTLKYDDAVVGTIAVDTTYLADNKTLTLNEFGPTTQGTFAFAVTNLKGNVDASGIDGNGTGRVSVAAASGVGFDISVIGGGGNDTITGGAGADSISGAAGSNSLTGGAGADVFTIANSGSSVDSITDLALNNTSDVVVNSGMVEATLQGNWVATNQTTNNSGSYASFVINSSGKNVDLSLASGNGYKVVSSGAASVIGSSAGDYVQVGTGAAYGNVTATGGAGNDIYYALAGSITITDLGNGSDNFTIEGFGAVDATVTNNWISGGGGWATHNQAAVSSAVIRVGSNYTVDLSADNYANGFTFLSTGTGAVTGSNTAGSGDVFENTSGSATFTGLGGLDTFRSITDTMTISDLAAGGLQEVVTNSAAASVVATLAGNWVATSETKNLGDYTNFVITTSGWSANLGGAAVDVVGSATQGYTITNIGAAASLTGSAAADSITGGSGNDTIAGGAGADYITVGAGADTIVINAVAGSSSDSNNAHRDTFNDLSAVDKIQINASEVNDFSVSANVEKNGIFYLAHFNGSWGGDGDVALYGWNGLGYGTAEVQERTIVNITGTSGNDTISGGVNNDTISGGAGNDSLSGLGGADSILDGSGQDDITAGAGADEVTLSSNSERDNINQEASDGVAASATGFQGAAFAVGDTITFGNGVDVVNNFLAGASAGADQLAIGTTVSTSLLGGATGARTIGWLSGNYDSVTHVFTVTANGSGSDTLVLKGSDLSAGTSRAVLLVGVDSDQLVDSNFAGTDINIVPLYDPSTAAFTFQAGSAASNRLYMQTASSTPTGGAAAEGYIYNSSSYTTLQADASPNPATGFSQTAVTTIDLSNLAGDAGVDIKIDGAGGSTNLASVTGTSGGDNFVYASQDFGAANVTVDGGSAGTDTVVFTTAAGGTIYGTSAGSGMHIANIDAISLTAGSSGHITLDASVTDAIVVTNASTTNSATVTLNGNSASRYSTSSAGVDSVTVGAAGQMVNLLGGGDLVNGGALSLSGSYTATGSANTFTLGGGTLGAASISGFQTLNLTDSESISAATILGLTTLTMTDNDVLTMTAAQNQFLQGSASVAGANQSVTLTTAGGITGIDGIETYNLANGTNTFSFSTVASQSANGSGGVDTFVMRGNATAAGYSGNDIYQVLSGTNNVITTLGFGPSSPVVQVSAGATATGTTSGDWTAGVGSSNAGSITINLDGAAGGAYTLDLHNATGTQGWILNGLGKVGIIIGSSQGDAITAGDTVYGRTVTITGGAGIDSIYGPTGTSGDNAVFNVASGAELDEDATVVGGSATDTINFTSAATDIDDTDFANVLNVDKVQLADGVNVATLGLNAAAAGITSITGGTGSDTIDASAMGVAVTIDAGQGDDTLIVGATTAAGSLGLGAGDNTVSLASGGSLAGATTTATGGSWNLSLADNASVTLRSANLTGGSGVQLSSIVAAGTETVTVNTTSAVLTGYTLNTAVENWNVGTVGNGNNSVTLGAVAQNATFGSGNDTLTLGLNGTQGSYDLGGGTNTINLADSISVSAATVTATGGTYGLNLLDGGSSFDTTIKTALLQNATTVTTTGSGAITLRIDGTASGFVNKQIDADIDVLRIVTGNYANSITLLGGSQSFYGGAGDDTVNIGGRTMTGALDFGGGTVNALVATNGANIAGVNGGLSTTANALTLTGGMTMTAVQYADFVGRITAGGSTDSITLTTALGSAAVLDSQVETFVFANVTGNAVTTGATGQTLNADALGDGRSLTLSGGNNVTVSLVNGDLSAGTASGNLTVTAGAGTNVIQTGSGNDSITGGTGVDQIDISAGGADHITLGNSANGIDVITGFTSNDTFHFAALANGYLNDSATTYGQATLADAASAAALNAGAYKAIGFVYQSSQYILINVDTAAYVASTDALVQVIGTDLATLSSANFNV
jgi:Ca2+-binding RTX toxin-like protein